MKDKALDFAVYLDRLNGYTDMPNNVSEITQQASNMIRQQAKRIEELETVLQSIANEHLELSHDKIKWQVQDHIRWAKDVLKECQSESKV